MLNSEYCETLEADEASQESQEYARPRGLTNTLEIARQNDATPTHGSEQSQPKAPMPLVCNGDSDAHELSANVTRCQTPLMDQKAEYVMSIVEDEGMDNVKSSNSSAGAESIRDDTSSPQKSAVDMGVPSSETKKHVSSLKRNAQVRERDYHTLSAKRQRVERELGNSIEHEKQRKDMLHKIEACNEAMKEKERDLDYANENFQRAGERLAMMKVNLRTQKAITTAHEAEMNAVVSEQKLSDERMKTHMDELNNFLVENRVHL